MASAFVFLIFNNPDVLLEARRAVQRNLWFPFRARSVLIESVVPLIELIFNLHSIVGFRCRSTASARVISARDKWNESVDSAP